MSSPPSSNRQAAIEWGAIGFIVIASFMLGALAGWYIRQLAYRAAGG